MREKPWVLGRLAGFARAGGAPREQPSPAILILSFFITIIIYIIINNLGVSAGAGDETWGGLGPALDPFGAPLDSVGIPTEFLWNSMDTLIFL